MTSAGWFLAPSLVQLRAEVDARWPHRDKTLDGSIGDVAHSVRESDHNPDELGCVHAIDITHDPRHGCDGRDLVRWLIAAAIAGDGRCWYLIFDGHIYSRTYGWERQTYHGPSAHTHHVHVSIMYERAAEQDTSRWLRRPEKHNSILEEDDGMVIIKHGGTWYDRTGGALVKLSPAAAASLATKRRWGLARPVLLEATDADWRRYQAAGLKVVD